MATSVLDLFKIGIAELLHTVGPMKAAPRFAVALEAAGSSSGLPRSA